MPFVRIDSIDEVNEETKANVIDLPDMRTGEQQWPGVVYTFEKDYQRNITSLKKM